MPKLSDLPTPTVVDLRRQRIAEAYVDKLERAKLDGILAIRRGDEEHRARAEHFLAEAGELVKA